MLKDQRYRPFYLPIIFVVLFFAIFILSQVLSFEHLFGIKSKDSLLDLLAFEVQAPFKHYGLTFISSYFFHYNMTHLIVNALMFFTIAAQLRMSVSALRVSSLIFLTHTLTLLFLIYSTSGSDFFLGSSASTMGLLAYRGLLQKKYFLLVAGIIYFLYALYFATPQSTLGIFAHLIGIAVGILLYVGHRLTNRV